LKIAIIAGTGFYNLPALEGQSPTTVDTTYGQAVITTGKWHGAEVAFLTRHGVNHTVPPSQVNYRANIQALKNWGTELVIGVNVVGGVDKKLKPGALQLVDDFIDFTHGRADTFFDGVQEGGVQHIDMTYIYDKKIQKALAKSAKKADIKLHEGGIYAVYNGPRFESPAEIRMCAMLGVTVVGMTGVPEATLAREAGLRYAAIAAVANPAAGLSKEEISHEGVGEVIKGCAGNVITIIDGAIKILAS
jgi:5'-deoxy-5'-methylthioadenosine phosphorylase